MEGDRSTRDKTLVDLTVTPEVSRSQQWAAGGLALLLLTCWGAWVLLIGFRPCALSYQLWP
jgi:hypothetical protein